MRILAASSIVVLALGCASDPSTTVAELAGTVEAPASVETATDRSMSAHIITERPRRRILAASDVGRASMLGQV